MVRSGTATTTCETQTPLRSWGGFGELPPLQTFTTVRLSVYFLHNDQPTASPAVWTYIVPSEAMQHAVLLGRDSWMRFSERSYRTLTPRPSDNRILGILTLEDTGGLSGGTEISNGRREHEPRSVGDVEKTYVNSIKVTPNWVMTSGSQPEPWKSNDISRRCVCSLCQTCRKLSR